jgi:hypothetical protein
MIKNIKKVSRAAERTRDLIYFVKKAENTPNSTPIENPRNMNSTQRSNESSKVSKGSKGGLS